MKKGPVRPHRAHTTPWVAPPKAAQKIAEQALRQRQKLAPSKRGGLSRAAAQAQGITSGVERAKSIARGELQPAQDIRDFFNRFKGTYQDALLKGKAWEDSKVQQSWDLWGGTPMWDAAKKALEDKDAKSDLRSIMSKAMK